VRAPLNKLCYSCSSFKVKDNKGGRALSHSSPFIDDAVLLPYQYKL